MTTLHNILQQSLSTKYAHATGTTIHNKLRHITISTNNTTGDKQIIAKIKQNPDLSVFFAPNTKTEVPIAGTINNHFISRRIDRLAIDNAQKKIHVLDYKSDIDRHTFRPQYTKQLQEYILLLKEIYPEYKIDGHILWTHDFSLEKVI